MKLFVGKLNDHLLLYIYCILYIYCSYIQWCAGKCLNIIPSGEKIVWECPYLIYTYKFILNFTDLKVCIAYIFTLTDCFYWCWLNSCICSQLVVSVQSQFEKFRWEIMLGYSPVQQCCNVWHEWQHEDKSETMKKFAKMLLIDQWHEWLFAEWGHRFRILEEYPLNFLCCSQCNSYRCKTLLSLICVNILSVTSLGLDNQPNSKSVVFANSVI